MNQVQIETGEPLGDIVRQAQRGDRLALQTLYGRYSAALLDYARKRGADLAHARQCVADVFREVWQTIRGYTFRGENLLRGWLYTLANAWLRRSEPAPERQSWRIAPRQTPSDTESALPRALAQLTTEQQDVIALRFFGHLSPSEIASTLALSEDTVKRVQRHAMLRLHTLIGTPLA